MDRTPAELGLTYEAVEFPATDGVACGWFCRALAEDADGAVAASDDHLAHGFRATAWSPGAGAELAALVGEGFNAMFDFRNHGESDGDVTTSATTR